MSPFLALAATTGTTPDPPFLPPFEGAPVETGGVVLPLGHRYQAPAPTRARKGNHSHRAPEGRRFGDFVTTDAVASPCSVGGRVWFFMSPTAGYPYLSRDAPRHLRDPPRFSYYLIRARSHKL